MGWLGGWVGRGGWFGWVEWGGWGDLKVEKVLGKCIATSFNET